MTDPRIEGLAAITICESVLIALVDLGILSAQDAEDLLLDAENAHRNAGEGVHTAETHHEIADVIRAIRQRKDGVATVSRRKEPEDPDSMDPI